ncbi:hypothetical protein A9R01_03345, partial ['Osedax' symbiont bacterium Rs2_46_30_T18]
MVKKYTGYIKCRSRFLQQSTGRKYLIKLTSERIMSKETLLIIGAAGNNGVATIAALTEQHAQRFNVRAGVRSEHRAIELKSKFPLIETVVLDLDQPETLTTAMQGVDKLFL